MVKLVKQERINPEKVIQERLVSAMGLDKYAFIMKNVVKSNIAEDKEFQRIFDRFYMVRRDEEWRDKYYQLFESIKDKDASFEFILDKLYEETGNVEASFSSKMLATLDDSKPIWDQYVIKNLGIKTPGQNSKDRLKKIISLYAEIEDWYYRFLKTDNGKECIGKFDEVLPDYKWISDVKKIDFYLWSIR